MAKSKPILLLAFMFQLYHFSYAQLDTLWTRTYGKGVGTSIIKTNDDNFLIAGGKREIDGEFYANLRLIKINNQGDIIWDKTVGDTGLYRGYTVRKTPDHGFIILGTKITSWEEMAVWLIKTNSDGDTIWTKAIGNNGVHEGNCIQLTSDGGFIIVGTTYNDTDAVNAIWLIKTNSFGDTLWSKKILKSYWSAGKYINQTSDSGYVILGTVYESGLDSRNTLILKTDSNGKVMWSKSYNVPNYEQAEVNDEGNCMAKADDGYICLSNVEHYGVWAIKTDFSGDTLWTRALRWCSSLANINCGCSSIIKTSNGHFMISGGESNSGGYWRPPYGWMMMIDTDGIIQWSTNFDMIMGINSAIQIDGNIYLATGPSYYGDLLLAKLDSSVSALNRNDAELDWNFSLSQNYPNPFNPSTSIEFTLPKSEYVELKVYDILGKEVAKLVSNKLNQGSHSYQFDGKNLASGIYYYQLVAGDFNQVKKMILLR